MVDPPDLGAEALDLVRKYLMVDEPWIEHGDRCVAWVGYRLRQEIRAEKPYQDREFNLVRVSVTVPIVDAVHAAPDEVDSLLGDVNRYAVGAMYLYDSSTKSIFSFVAVTLHTDTLDWRAKQLSILATCQLGFAETEADYLAHASRGEVARRSHPMLGQRKTPDEMLRFADSVFGREGNFPSRYSAKSEFESIERIIENINAVTWGASEDGIAIELPFDQGTSLISIHADEPHPLLGNGLTVNTFLRLEKNPLILSKAAAKLRTREWAGECPTQCFGAWGAIRHLNGVLFLGHTVFFPNVLYLGGIVGGIFVEARIRAQWVNSILNPGVPEAEVRKIDLEGFSKKPDGSS